MQRKRRRPREPDAPAAPDAEEPRAARLFRRWWWLVAPVVAVLAFRDLAHFGFVGDARFLIADNRFAHSLGYWKATLLHDYFWSSSGNVIPYWRPLTKLSWLFEWQLFGDWAGGYALVNLAWFALGVGGVEALARRVGLPRGAALAAAVLYALAPVMVAPVSMIMARSDVVAAACVTWAVVAWLAWREGGPRRRSWAALHVVATLAALGSKESAIVLPLVVAAWSVLEGDLAADRRRRLWTAAPSLLLGVVYFVVRRALLEGQAKGLSGTALSLDALRISSGLGAYLWNTFPLSLSSSVRDVSFGEARSAAWLGRAAVACLLLLAAAVWAFRRRERKLGALLLWTVAGVLPVLVARDISVIDVTGKYPLADRWLAASLAPAMVAWALLAWRALVRLSSARAPAIAAACVGAWALVLLARSHADRRGFSSDLAMLDNEDRVFYYAVPERYRTREDRCRFQERRLARALMKNEPEQVVALAPRAVRVCGDKPEVLANWLRALVDLGRFRVGEPLAEELARHPPRDTRSHAEVALDVGLTFAESDKPRRALPALERAVQLGAVRCGAFVPLAERARRARRPEVAATYVQTAYVCGRGLDASLLLAGATWLVASGDTARAARLIAALYDRRLGPDQAAQLVALRRAIESGSAGAGLARPVAVPR